MRLPHQIRQGNKYQNNGNLTQLYTEIKAQKWQEDAAVGQFQVRKNRGETHAVDQTKDKRHYPSFGEVTGQQVCYGANGNGGGNGRLHQP